MGFIRTKGIEAAQLLQNVECVSVYEPTILRVLVTLLDASPGDRVRYRKEVEAALRAECARLCPCLITVSPTPEPTVKDDVEP